MTEQAADDIRRRQGWRRQIASVDARVRSDDRVCVGEHLRKLGTGIVGDLCGVGSLRAIGQTIIVVDARDGAVRARGEVSLAK